MEALTGPPDAYNEVLYPARCIPQTHPNRLAAIACLRGLNPAPLDRCRVLELGCNFGINLAAMAGEFPESEFVGVDLAGNPIAAGREFAAGLRLGNLSLHARDLVTVTRAEFGRFDYLIAHGLYSWVPAPVRVRILEICQELLAPDGVAYISYNAYPGNHLRELVRGMMRFHAAQFNDPADRVGQARGLLKFVAEACREPDYYHTAVKDQFERLLKIADPVVFHDDLCDQNQPFYFYEFMADASRYGLQYLGEAGANELPPQRYEASVFQTLGNLGNASEVVREQYKDFVRGCAFRKTLLCREEKAITPALLTERVPHLFAMCDAILVEQRDTEQGCVSVFRQRDGTVVEATHPLVSAALAVLCSEWPCSVSFPTLLHRAAAELAGAQGNAEAITAEETLSAALAHAHQAGFLTLHVHPYRVVNRAGKWPAVSRLARYQLERGELATNQLHASIRFPDSLSRRLVQLLDGTRDRPALIAELTRAVLQGEADLFENQVPITAPDTVQALMAKRLEEGLASLAREAMLVS
jgi:SAM-dependent methyltransferase/methyltransferase-like protein